ncbi:Uncharacterized protein HZ326_24689, partial [Fusarium oxysporum f. sp. albedinis]
ELGLRLRSKLRSRSRGYGLWKLVIYTERQLKNRRPRWMCR